jgi:hypothetical protein
MMHCPVCEAPMTQTVAVAAMLEPSVPDHILERNNPYDLNDVARKRRPR